MNLKEILLGEMELHSSIVEDGLTCLLHSILFVRAPGPVRPVDSHCSSLEPLTFAKCGVPDIDKAVKDAIESFQLSLCRVSPNNSKGVVVLSFYEKRSSRGFFGLTNNEEKVYFERWKIPVIVNDEVFRPDDINDKIELKRIRDFGREQIQQRMMTIIESVNASMDHVPPSMYEYDFNYAERRDQHSIMSKIVYPPALFNPV
mmetsp:Transcript_12024/g.12088  ORF Transcript_12024/g.12088 Transcript_12024/m.12088 type:complete len:202 (+) Transcript_12024:140-745(+)|eukprot:CAMPEP_0182421472 /NCGR_PEP_ID=MMETSP1167-20130531/6891_1 /TAXON_ID=2988 /ORGANISM="Mallomonas Sp, Strain CCMP3275" /LENGTH=201 /DNA_ID=CAMNT_0024598663 /DNA_START=73 /DNA_END=678 /DNA_ORIENTATION=+